MDIFGIGQAIKGAVKIYFQASRCTGRTVSMVESVKEGDRIIFSHSAEARRVEKLLNERGIKNVECRTAPPRQAERLLEFGSIKGRTIFDHSWVEEYYLAAIKRCGKDIDYFQKNLSGFGEPHLKTRRRATEMSRWDI